VVKTTIYLPEAMKLQIEALARQRGCAEADVIRAALAEYTSRERPQPRLGLFEAEPIEDWDEAMRGFGED
jgi:predicted transcriptional regulator